MNPILYNIFNIMHVLFVYIQYTHADVNITSPVPIAYPREKSQIPLRRVRHTRVFVRHKLFLPDSISPAQRRRLPVRSLATRANKYHNTRDRFPLTHTEFIFPSGLFTISIISSVRQSKIIRIDWFGHITSL